MVSKEMFTFLLVILILSPISAELEIGFDNPEVPRIIMGEPEIVAGNITNNINQTTYENNFDQSLNTTDDVQFNNVTLVGWSTGLFDLAVSSLSNFLSISNNGTTIEIDFNESYLNASIGSYVSNITGGGSGTSGIWENVSGTATFDGDANVIGNLTIDSKMNFTESEIYVTVNSTTYGIWI